MAGETRVDLATAHAVHLVGIGGAGMSAIATVLARLGHRVSGSDQRASPVTERLAALGIDVRIGHGVANVGAVDVVAISSAVGADNPEVLAANAAGIPVVRRADMLAAVCAVRRTLAIAGTHGKTTTSAMVSLILREAELRPSFIVGGDVNQLGVGAHWDTGELFVVEADESDGTFLELGAWGGVVTNVEADHLDHYGSEAALRAAFERFVAGLPGPRVVGIDLPWGRELATALARRGVPVATFGRSADATWRIAGLETGRRGARFDLWQDDEPLGSVEVGVPGAHNAANATAAIALCAAAGAPIDAARRALAGFGGVARRLTDRGHVAGVALVDDYAHLPREVEAALGALAAGGWSRVVAVFQPHRYSRTAAVGAEFAAAFVDADVVVITDVYAAGEAPLEGVDGRVVADAVRRANPGADVRYVASRAALAGEVAAELRPGDVCVSLGAGDITRLADELLARLGEPAGEAGEAERAERAGRSAS
ncbi:MAG: UDP-N-acetylmuramate--L-alanine ligase [Acidimicrobiia bacterium]|nr:UDP-N-acetylmuramate--L-alanine ligase [Acidimicrobiia bacterium]